jgi:hypothetical protein
MKLMGLRSVYIGSSVLNPPHAKSAINSAKRSGVPVLSDVGMQEVMLASFRVATGAQGCCIPPN